ncbi:thymidylate kinase [Streptacidiphilus sp. MAP12-33]|uniref:hypothetical protein n=1 Tax=Streptacidiphilus sp. MAP12-33 TaxID=3156266 RepID=UPI0035123E60
MRILVDGLDLSGKTTLVQALIAELDDRGVTAVRHRGMLAHHHPVEPLLKRLPLVRQADSGFITAAFLTAGYALDSLLVGIDPPRPAGAVLLQEGYADRTLAFGIAGGPYLTALLGVRWLRLFAPFDLAVYVHAPLEVRAGRMSGREDDLDSADVRSCTDAHFAEVFNTTLLRVIGRRHHHLLVFDTSQHTPQEMAAQIAGRLLGNRVPAQRSAA